MLALAVQPPSQARLGVPLYPPVAARLSSETSIYEELAHTFATVTLVDSSGNLVSEDLIAGGKFDSAHPLPDVAYNGSSSSSQSSSRKDRAYFYFPDLIINQPGRYKVRVNLCQMEYTDDSYQQQQMRVLEIVESRSISVEDRDVERTRPSSRERAFLKVLKDDGQMIPSSHHA